MADDDYDDDVYDKGIRGGSFEGYSGETIIVYKKTFYVSDNLHVSVCNAYMIIVIGLGLRIASVECNVYWNFEIVPST